MKSVHDMERHRTIRLPRIAGGMPVVWLVIAMVVTCGTFSGVYITTGDIWTAALAGGIPALIYMAGLTVHATCTPASRRCRIAVMLVAVTVLTGISAEFMVLSSRTRWQADMIAGTGVSYDRSAMMSALFSTASPVFASYQQQPQRKRRAMAEIFKDSWSTRDWTTGMVTLDGPSERVNVYASTTPDGAIVLTAVAAVTPGGDAAFANVNGCIGRLQSRLLLNGKGMSYEIEN